MANGETLQVVLVITVQNKISLIPKSKCAVTVLMDSCITTLPIAVVYVHYTKSIKELAECKVTVDKTVLTIMKVNTGTLPQTDV